MRATNNLANKNVPLRIHYYSAELVKGLANRGTMAKQLFTLFYPRQNISFGFFLLVLAVHAHDSSVTSLRGER